MEIGKWKKIHKHLKHRNKCVVFMDIEDEAPKVLPVGYTEEELEKFFIKRDIGLIKD